MIVEHVARFETPRFAVRVWMDDSRRVDTDALRDLINTLSNAGFYCYKVANEIIGFDGMNAVEVVDHKGVGVVLYKDWP